MKNETLSYTLSIDAKNQSFFPMKQTQPDLSLSTEPEYMPTLKQVANEPVEILVITSFPPRECGIATYSQDLIKAIVSKFSNKINVKVCALEAGESNFDYPEEVVHRLDTSKTSEYIKMASVINSNDRIKSVLIQHEFGFFKERENAFMKFLYMLSKPIILVYHTVLPKPDKLQFEKVNAMLTISEYVVVMTQSSSSILIKDYNIPKEKIKVIAHGTHLVPLLSELELKMKFGLKNRTVLTTFGLLSSGKNIETTLKALPEIVKTHPEVLFLIIGKTHPEVVKSEGEKYREELENIVLKLGLKHNVLFINNYLALPVLLEYLQLTDIYLFTSNDPNQAVSGTFVYAMSCGCPIISTPIPHAKELLNGDNGLIFNFGNSKELSECVLKLMNDTKLRRNIRLNSIQKIVSTAWENSAVSHVMLLKDVLNNKLDINFNIPNVNLEHIKKMTTEKGIIQFSKINQPDPTSGYTLDDNARALATYCMHYKQYGDKTLLAEIKKYFLFVKDCQQSNGSFLNYININGDFTLQNAEVNLDDSNGRAIWALGYMISLSKILPYNLTQQAKEVLNKSLPHIKNISSTRALAFSIKGLYYAYLLEKNIEFREILVKMANKLIQMHRHESEKNWNWYESYLTYANSILPEAMLYAYRITGNKDYMDAAKYTFDFLLSQIFNNRGIEVISNKNWLTKGQKTNNHGEQPIDVAYTILTLDAFYETFNDESYLTKITIAFNWFLGNNRLNQIIYNPCTGGCYDGLEENHVNINQGAESTLSYAMARLCIEKYNQKKSEKQSENHREWSQKNRIIKVEN